MEGTTDVSLGLRIHGGWEEPFGLSPSDRLRHVYIVGGSGTGKTTTLRNMVVQDILAGRGVGFIDPHGDDAWDILDYIPKHRVEDVVYVDLADSKFPVALNLIASGAHPDDKARLVSELVEIFRGLWADSWGQRLQYILTATLNALIECENVSIIGVPRMYWDARYRKQVAKQIQNPFVRWFWTFGFEEYSGRFREEAIAPIENKIGQLLMSPRFLNVLGQTRTRIEARYMMDNGKIFVANLSKGKIGPNEARLIGAILMNQFYLAAMSRSDISREENRRPFYLYVDEFHSFISDSFVGALSEVRKYGLGITLAHQYLDQIGPDMRSAVFGNVGSLVAFRVGRKDAEELEGGFGRTYAAEHFTALSNGEAYVRPLCSGRTLDPFLCRMHPRFGRRYGRRKKIIRRSRERYATRREKVERRINAWFKSAGRN